MFDGSPRAPTHQNLIDGQLRPEVRRKCSELVLFDLRIERRWRGAELENCQEGDNEINAVREENRDAIVRDNALR